MKIQFKLKEENDKNATGMNKQVSRNCEANKLPLIIFDSQNLKSYKCSSQF